MSFWNFFKKKTNPIVKPKQVKRVVHYKDQTFDVGKTIISVKFKDLRELNTIVYGYVWQFRNTDVCGEVIVYNSKSQAREYIKSLNGTNSCLANITDNHIDPKICMIGDVIELKIGESYPFEVNYTVGYWVNEEC